MRLILSVVFALLTLVPAYALPTGVTVSISKAQYNAICKGPETLEGSTISCYVGCGNNICKVSCTVNAGCEITGLIAHRPANTVVSTTGAFAPPSDSPPSSLSTPVIGGATGMPVKKIVP